MINDSGEVVGTSESSQGPRAFIWTRAAGMRDLNDFIADESDFVLFEAAGVTIGEPSLRLVVTRMRMEVRTPIMSFQREFCS